MTGPIRIAIGGALLLAILGASGCPRPQITPSVPPLGFAIGEAVTITQRATGVAPPPVRPVVRRQFGALTGAARALLTPANVKRGTRLRFELFDNLNVTAVVEYVEAYRDNGVTLVATGESHPGHVALSYDAGQLAVFFALPTEGDIELVPLTARELLVSQLETQLRVACDASGRIRPDSRLPTRAPVKSSTPSQIDVGVMYTGAALCSLRPSEQCPDENFLALLLTGWAMASSKYFTCSGIDARLNVVGLKKLNYQETGFLNTDLTGFNTPAASQGRDVAEFREANHADVVLVLVAKGDDYGLAEVFTTDYTVEQYKSIATGVAVAKVAFGHTLLHEVGHIMGAGHQKKQGTGRYSYSRGNVIGAQIGDLYTLMAQGRGWRLTLFAGPDVPLGKGKTGSSDQDNVRTINTTRTLVEGFQVSNHTPFPAVPCSGTLFPFLSTGADPAEQEMTGRRP